MRALCGFFQKSLQINAQAQNVSSCTYVRWLQPTELHRNSFEFKGSIIFITNVKFERTRGKLKDHLDAIMSRCHYLDLTLDTMRDKFLRCKQIVADGMLNSYKFSEHEQKDLMEYIYTNKNRLREMSLRMVLKIADLRKMNANKWKSYAESTCMKRI